MTFGPLPTSPPARHRVLIVDDDPELREALFHMLETSGFDVAGVAGDGADALANLDGVRPDIVLLDYRMPGMDGVELTQRIRERSPRTEVIMFTAYDETSLSLDATMAGVFAFLVKGCAPSLILQALRAAGEHHRESDVPQPRT